MTRNNNHAIIEELPPSGLDIDTRRRVTGYIPPEATVINTGTTQLESPTVQDIAVQREDNPFLRLMVIVGVMGVVCMVLFGIFAILSPKAPVEVVAETEVEETAVEETDYQAKLAFRDQFHSLEKKSEPELEVVESNTETKLPPVTSAPVVSAQPTAQPVARPVPQPIARPVPRPVQVKTEPKIEPQEQWQALANFGMGVSSRSIPKPQIAQRNTIQNNSQSTLALLANNTVSQGELGIQFRQSQASFPKPAPAIALERGITKGTIELPLVWDSSLTSAQQQSNQITVVLDEPIYDLEGKVVFEPDSVVIVEVQSINDANGLVTAYVTQINDTTFNPGELILRNDKKSALVAKASKRSNFGDRLLVGGIDSLGNFGRQLLIPETSSTISNGSTIVSSQSRNSIGRDLAGSTLDGFGSSLSNELEQRSIRNQIGDGGTIFTLAQGTTVYLTNIHPIIINP